MVYRIEAPAPPRRCFCCAKVLRDDQEGNCTRVCFTLRVAAFAQAALKGETIPRVSDLDEILHELRTGSESEKQLAHLKLENARMQADLWEFQRTSKILSRTSKSPHAEANHYLLGTK